MVSPLELANIEFQTVSSAPDRMEILLAQRNVYEPAEVRDAGPTYWGVGVR